MSIQPHQLSLIATLASMRIPPDSDEARKIYEMITQCVLDMVQVNEAMDHALRMNGTPNYVGGTTHGSPGVDEEDEEDLDYFPLPVIGPSGTTPNTRNSSEQGANGPNGPLSSVEVPITGPDSWEVVMKPPPLPGLLEVLKGSRKFAWDILRDVFDGTIRPF